MSEKIPDNKVYLTPKEAADFLRKTYSTLEEWRNLKKGPRYFKLGPGKKANILYARADLEAWLKLHMVSTRDQE